MPSISINTNLSSLIAQQSLKQSSNKLNLAVERMSTGFKINHAKDNAANYSISTNMTTKIGAYQVAEDNVAMGLDLLSTANGSLDQISDKLSRLRALAEQSANGTYGGGKSKLAINAEANSLVDEIERLYNTTTYNGINLSKGKIETSNFIKDIERRDTSKMDKFEEVKIDEALTTGTYSISTAEGLAKLATMTNNGLIGTDTEFVLANDIDLKEWCEANSATGGWVPIGRLGHQFIGDFDGNGYKVLNLTISRNENYQGLFGYSTGASISNLGVLSVDVNAARYVGGIAGEFSFANIENCYSTGNIILKTSGGGISGYSKNSSFNYCYSFCNIQSQGNSNFGIGGVCGTITTRESFVSTIKDCYAYGSLTSSSNQDCIGGLIGVIALNSNLNIESSYSLGSTNNETSGILVGKIATDVKNVSLRDCLYTSEFSSFNNSLVSSNLMSTSLVAVNNSQYKGDVYKLLKKGNIFINSDLTSLSLQIGAKGDWASALSVELGYRLDGISALRNIGTGNDDYLSKVDILINSISAKAVEFGAAQNRLESALDEISTQYENLVSSRSTLRDADISEVSSEYIRQQILQEASATLLATANQNPSIALQLL